MKPVPDNFEIKRPAEQSSAPQPPADPARPGPAYTPAHSPSAERDYPTLGYE